MLAFAGKAPMAAIPDHRRARRGGPGRRASSPASVPSKQTLVDVVDDVASGTGDGTADG